MLISHSTLHRIRTPPLLPVIQGMGVHISARSDDQHNINRDPDILQLHHQRIEQPHLHVLGMHGIAL